MGGMISFKNSINVSTAFLNITADSDWLQLHTPYIMNPADTYIDQSNHTIYILDKNNGKIACCDLSSIYDLIQNKTSNVSICYLVTTLHSSTTFYSMQLLDGVVYYTVWNKGEIYAYDLESKQTISFAKHLTRPTRFLINQNFNFSGFGLELTLEYF